MASFPQLTWLQPTKQKNTLSLPKRLRTWYRSILFPKIFFAFHKQSYAAFVYFCSFFYFYKQFSPTFVYVRSFFYFYKQFSPTFVYFCSFFDFYKQFSPALVYFRSFFNFHKQFRQPLIFLCTHVILIPVASPHMQVSKGNLLCMFMQNQGLQGLTGGHRL